MELLANNIKKTKGKILYVSNRLLLKSVGNILYKSIDSGNKWSIVNRIGSNSFKFRIAYKSHLICRLLRRGIHHANVFTDNLYGVIIDKNIGVVSSQISSTTHIPGSRPLSLEHINNDIIFGEYRPNRERSEIGLFAFNKNETLTEKLTFSGIRHIHGTYQDPYTHKIWITTGDKDYEAAIYSCEKDFTSLQKVLYGSQQTRTIKLLFTKSDIYFGTDAPSQINYICRMKKDSNKVERLTKVGNSIFHGCKVGDWLFFSTAVEPSKVNQTKYAEIWASPNGTDWKCILKLKKDILPMRYFQYGQIFFPTGESDGKNLWFSPFATKYSNRSYRVSIEEIEKQFNNI